ncbi:MAG TPA: triose-phosphate isomerase [Candidatus Binatia bacterium]
MKAPLVVANWKMHGTQAEAATLAREVVNGGNGIGGVEIVLAPPFTALATVSAVIRDSAVRLGAQNIHWEMKGAFTGEISPIMVRELGCEYVIIGHSERRRLFHETDRMVGKKIAAALSVDLAPIVCVGETLQERQRKKTNAVIGRQLRAALKGLGKSAIKNFAVAYEPVWAIGTGRNATPEQVAAVHVRIRDLLRRLRGNPAAEDCRILYGGSVNPDNAAELARVPDVNGFLVGGASLKAESFLGIARAF